MTTVTKAVTFDAAHILTNHNGLCKNLHGHTYRVEADVTTTDASADMVIDFKDLKTLLNKEICDVFDHAFIYNTTSEGEKEIAEVGARHGLRVVPIPFRSTAENLARLFFDRLAPQIPGLSAVRVWETPSNRAEYRP